MSHTRLFPRHRLAIACILASVSSFSFAEDQCDVIDLQQAADLALFLSLLQIIGAMDLGSLHRKMH